MDSSFSPPIRKFIPSTLILLILGWGGLAYLVLFTTPDGGTRWLFFVATVLAFTGLFLPVMAFLNVRFPSAPPPNVLVVMRQALWFGVFMALLVWLQIGRVLTFWLALMLAAGIAAIEWLLRLRERSLWRPEQGG